jgi:cell division protein FtsQ
LARSIALPEPRSFAGLTLPSLGRRRIVRLPGGAALEPGNRAWRLLVIFCLLSAAGYGIWMSGKGGSLYHEVEGLAVAAGFGVKQISVEGQQHLSDAELAAALGAGPGTMMFAFDTDAAKVRLEAVPWIKQAQVMRLLPSTLQVVIEERVPFAVWQSKGQTYVVDREGAVLAPAIREAYADLPLVVGEGAGKNAAGLFAELAFFEDVEKQVIAAIRVGDRRWTLKLATGADVMLPDDNIADALKTLVGLDQERGLLHREIAAVDLRLADRVSVKLREANSAAPAADAPDLSEVPTASTKGNI